MEIAEVVDQETLRVYLALLPKQEREDVSQRVTSNAATRILPVAICAFFSSGKAVKLSVTPVAVFGAVAIACVARETAHRAFAASAAYAADAATYAAARAAVDTYYYYAVRAAAANAAGNANAATAASTTATAAANKFDVWQLVRHDLSADGAVWPDGPPPALQQSWSDAVAAMQMHPADWSIWIHWYNRILQDRDWHPTAMGDVMQKITRDDWEKGPAHINPMFDEVLALYLKEDAAEPPARATDDAAAQLIDATPLAEDVIFDPVRQVLVLRPTDRVGEDYLSDVRAQIRGACDIFDHIASPTNAAGALSEEVKVLRRALEQNPDRPVILLRTVSRVLGRLDHKVMQFACPSPEEDANVDDFKDVLTNVQLDLIALSPEVRNYHEATKPQLSSDTVASAVEAAHSIASVSDAELAEIIGQETGVLGDPVQDDIAQRDAFYRLAGLIARGYRAVREATKEGAGFVKDASVVVGGLTAGGTGVAWFLSPAFRETIIALLKSFEGIVF